MPRFYQRVWWRRCRTGFRWCRITVWLLLLAVVCGLIYLNQVGLPDTAKRALITALRERKVDFKFENMRLDFFGGVVAERVFVEEAERAGVVSVAADAVGLQLNPRELLRGRFVVDSLNVRNATVAIPLSSNLVSTALTIDQINAHVALSGTGQWRVDELNGRCLGARLEFTGWMDHPEAITTWFTNWPSGNTNASRGPKRPWREQLRDIVALVERFEFEAPPTIRIGWRADGHDPTSLRATLLFLARGAQSDWGEARSLRLHAHTVPAVLRDEVLSGEVHLDVEGVVTEWGAAEDFSLVTQAWPFDADGHWLGANFKLEVSKPTSPWGGAERVEFETRTLAQEQDGTLPRTEVSLRVTAPQTEWARAAQLQARIIANETSFTNFIPAAGQLEIDIQSPASQWATAQQLQFQANGRRLAPAEMAATNAAWGFWSMLAPYAANWKLSGQAVTAKGVSAAALDLRGSWQGPRLNLDSVHARIAEGELNLKAQLDVVTRALAGDVSVSFDVKELGPVLGPKTMKWLDQFGWKRPPSASASAGLTLPAWTNSTPDFREEVVPTLWLRGSLTNGAGDFRKVTFEAARLDFQFTNEVWTLTNLIVTRPEGQLNIHHISNEKTRDHYWRIVGDGNVQDFGPIIDNAGADRALALFNFNGPVHLDGELWGRWRAPDLYGADVRVVATNFTFRGEAIDRFSASVQVTNRNVQFQNVELQRGTGTARVASGSFDAPTQRLWLTNAVALIEPGVILRPIGEQTVRTMAPYQFGAPPAVTVDGWLNVDNIKEVDLRFGVKGGPFRWERFNLATVNADLRWFGQSLTLTNVEGGFYDGKLTGVAAFDFTPTNGSRFAFDATVWETDLRKLLGDATAKSNRAEGVLNGRLVITDANTSDLTSWQGWGHANLRDGLLWDTPVFGFLSKPLNALAPGLGNSRASAATNTFVITNSVIRTDDLTIFTGPARLQYRGTVDFDTRVNARVEAELLRDSPLLGQVLSKMLLPVSKIFEYRVSGTIAEPNPQPIWFIPRLLFLPFAPVKSLQDIFTPNPKPEEKAAPTPAPASPQSPPQ